MRPPLSQMWQEFNYRNITLVMDESGCRAFIFLRIASICIAVGNSLQLNFEPYNKMISFVKDYLCKRN